MNLNDNPTKEQLADLLRPCDDRLDHVLWVGRDGVVHITPRGEFERTEPDEFARLIGVQPDDHSFSQRIHRAILAGRSFDPI